MTTVTNTPKFSVGEHVRIHAPGQPYHKRSGEVLGVDWAGEDDYIVRVRWPDGKDRRYAIFGWNLRKRGKAVGA